jgi:hypothetical protein
MAELLTFLTEFINTMGFPIAMVVYFIWDKEKTMKPMIDAVNNNTTVLTVLCEKVDFSQLKEGEE